jgi:4-hydroxy-2-oxoheptanedioate aldolase
VTKDKETQKLRLNRLIELFESNRPAVGIFAFSVASRSAAVIASSALDFVIIDLEHTPYDPKGLENYLLAMIDKRRILEKNNLQPDVVPLVRLPSNGREQVQYMIKQVLDLGVFGVVIPHIDTAADASAAVRAIRFAHSENDPSPEPRGQRGVGFPWAARYWGINEPEYGQRADLWPLDPAGELLLFCMIETQEGLRNCREIATTPGVSGILIGASDLSFSLEGFKHGLKVQDSIREIVTNCIETIVICGIVSTEDRVEERLNQGFRLMVVGTDAGLPASVERGIQIVRGHHKS